MRSVKLYQLSIDVMLASNLRVWWLINHSQVERAMTVLSSEMIPYHKPQTKHNIPFCCCCCSLFHITPSELHMSSLAFPSGIMCRCRREREPDCFLFSSEISNCKQHKTQCVCFHIFVKKTNQHHFRNQREERSLFTEEHKWNCHNFIWSYNKAWASRKQVTTAAVDVALKSPTSRRRKKRVSLFVHLDYSGDMKTDSFHFQEI